MKCVLIRIDRGTRGRAGTEKARSSEEERTAGISRLLWIGGHVSGRGTPSVKWLSEDEAADVEAPPKRAQEGEVRRGRGRTGRIQSRVAMREKHKNKSNIIGKYKAAIPSRDAHSRFPRTHERNTFAGESKVTKERLGGVKRER